jgi:hypothetical protein
LSKRAKEVRSSIRSSPSLRADSAAWKARFVSLAFLDILSCKDVVCTEDKPRMVRINNMTRLIKRTTPLCLFLEKGLLLEKGLRLAKCLFL